MLHHRTFEDCTELLWNGMLPDTSVAWQPARPGVGFQALADGIVQVAARNQARRLLSVAVEAYAASLGRNPELALGAPVLAARQLIQAMSAATGLLADPPTYALNETPQSIAQIPVSYTHLDVYKRQAQPRSRGNPGRHHGRPAPATCSRQTCDLAGRHLRGLRQRAFPADRNRTCRRL